jgi:cysteinyl-tRNA synthetase
MTATPSSTRYPATTPAPTPLVVAGHPLLPVGPVRLYTCGITPYDVTHLGHASTFVWADLLVSVARASGAEVLSARNVTDIDDVLTAEAERRGRLPDELAVTQEFLFERDMRALGVAEPHHKPRAHRHVPAVQRLAAALLASGHAYELEGHVLFRGAGLPARAGLGVDEALVASRDFGDQDGLPERESPFDVPVWRPSAEGQPSWPSPWGWGRPGWHAECAAMAMATLGTSIDVLLGGQDLAFPHHAYQVAMVEAASGVTPFAGAVLHVGEVRRDGKKMAKSTGNLVLVADLLEQAPGAVVRLMLLDRDWRRPWDWDPAGLDRAASTLDRLHVAAAAPASGGAPARDEVLRVLAGDLDVPAAIELAAGEGGEAARLLISVLGLGDATSPG